MARREDKKTTFVTFTENIKINPSVSSKMSSEDQTKFKAQILLDVCWVGNGVAESKGQMGKKTPSSKHEIHFRDSYISSAALSECVWKAIRPNK